MKFFLCIGLIAALFLILPPATAQKFLALDKPGGKQKRLRFFEGDRLTFRLKNDPTRYSGIITRLGDQSLYIGETRVLLSDIDAVTIRNRYGDSGILTSAPYILPLAGLIYFAADGLNPGSKLSSSTYIVSGSLIGAGLTIKLFQKKTYKIDDVRRLKIIDLGSEIEQGISVRGVVREGLHDVPVLAELVFEDLSDGQIKSVVSDGASGVYKITLPYGRAYRVYANSDLYISPERILDLGEYKDYAIVDFDMVLAPPVSGQEFTAEGLTFSKTDGTLLPGSFPPLDRIAAKLSGASGLKVEIVPLSSGESSESSRLKAEKIKQYLAEKGVDASRMAVGGYSEKIASEAKKKASIPSGTVLFRLK